MDHRRSSAHRALLAIATDTGFVELLTSLKFLIPAAIAVEVAMLKGLARPERTK